MGFLGCGNHRVDINGGTVGGLLGFGLTGAFIRWCGCGRSACHRGAEADRQHYDPSAQCMPLAHIDMCVMV